jgi:hypothetical protein
MTYERLWTAGWAVVVAAALGLTMLLWSPVQLLVLTVVLSACAWVSQVLMLPPPSPATSIEPKSGSLTALVRALCAGGVAVAGVGVLTVSPPLAALLTLVAGASSPRVLRWLSRRCFEDEAHDPVMSWSDAQLEAAWRDALIDLRGTTSVADIAELVALRQRYLDQLEQRDPRAYARWLARASYEDRQAS